MTVPKTCATCLHWSSRKPTDKQLAKMQVKADRIKDAIAQKRNEREALVDKIEKERGIPSEKRWHGEVWHSELVQILHREREELGKQLYALTRTMFPQEKGACLKAPPTIETKNVNQGIFGNQTQTRTRWPITRGEDTCAAYSKKVGL